MNSIFSQIKNEKSYMSGLRRHFHQYPEPSFEEYKTAEKIGEELSSLGIPNRRIGETGVLGSIKGKASGPEKIVVLRADIDALRIQEENEVDYRSKNTGVMHACGHDGHTAALLGAAKVLMSRRDNFCGEVRLVFQQAEEAGGGANVFIEERALENADRVLGVHMMSNLDAGKIALMPGPVFAAIDHFRITVKGKSAHIATPQDGSDALYSACQIVNAIQGLVTRGTSPVDTVLIGIGMLHAGKAHNIIADEAVMEGTLRTFSSKLRQDLKEKTANLCRYIALSSGTECSIEWRDFASLLVNNEQVTDEAREIASTFAKEVITDHDRMLGGDDFAEFLNVIPGVYAFIGCKKSGQEAIPLHNCHFDIDEDALVYAAGMYAEYAIWLLGGGA